MPPPTESEREVESLAGDLRRLESEYTKFFAGRQPKPPTELRAHVDREFRKWGGRAADSAVARFRLQTLQSRYSSFIELWDRAMRAREEGRPSPFAARRGAADQTPKLESEVFAAVLNDPSHQTETLRGLYEALMDARRQTGHDLVPYDRFSELVSRQVEHLRASGASDVVFRVSVADGRPNLTARPVNRRKPEVA